MKRDLLYLYDTSGNWIAFKIGRNLFNNDANWIGWFPWDDKVAVNTKGEYLGEIFGGNRLLKAYIHVIYPYPGYPGYPGSPGYPGYPGFAGYKYIPGTYDIDKNELKGD